MEEAPEGAQHLGLGVAPMGWSWAVFLAQSVLRDLVFGVEDVHGQKLFDPHVLWWTVPRPSTSHLRIPGSITNT